MLYVLHDELVLFKTVAQVAAVRDLVASLNGMSRWTSMEKLGTVRTYTSTSTST
jgi:hypothetical protein